MKKIIFLTIAFAATFSLYGQKDSIINIKRKVHSRKISFELRYISDGSWCGRNMIRITRNLNGNWKAQFGESYDDDNKYELRYYSKLDSVNWGDFENKLNEFLSLKLKTQDEIELRYVNNNEKYERTSKEYFNGDRFRDIPILKIELFDNITYQELIYIYPYQFIDELKEDGLNTIENEKFMEFTEYLIHTFTIHYCY